MTQEHDPTYEELKRCLADAEAAPRVVSDGQAEAEAREEHIKQVLLTIRNVNQIIVRETDPKRLIDMACGNLTETLGYHNAWIALLNKDGKVTMTASSGFDGGFGVMEERLQRTEFPAYMRQALGMDHSVLVKDPASECPDCPLSGEYGGRAGMTRRLSHKGTLYGILSVSVPAAYAFDAEEQSLFDELAEDLAFALHKIATEEQIHRLTRIVQTLPHPMSFISRDYRYLAVSDVYAAIYNVPREEIVGRTAADFLGQTVFEQKIRPHLDRCLTGETVRYQDQFEFPDKHLRWMAMEYHPYRDESGDIVAVISYGIDISEQQEAQEGLRRSEELFRKFFDTNLNYCYMISTDGIILDVNPAALNAMGYERDELVGQPLAMIYAPESQARRMEFFEKWKHTGHIFNEEMILQTKSGQRRTVLLNAGHVLDPEGRPLHSVSVQTDITDRKEAEKRLEQTLYATTGGIWYWHFPTNTLTFGPCYYTMLGYEPDAFAPTFENWLDLIHPEDRSAALSVAEAYLQTKPDLYTNEFRLRTKTGDYRWIHTRARVVERSPDGEAVLMIGNHEDITDRKLAEEVLRESDEKLRAMFDAAPLAIVLLDRGGRVLDSNDEHANRLQMIRDQILGKCIWDFLPASVLDHRRRQVEAVFRTGKPLSAEDHRGDAWNEYHIHPAMWNERGEVAAVIVTSLDITARKRGEEALAESERQKGLILNATSEMVAYYDLELRVIWANRAAEESVGALPGGLVGKHCYEIWAQRADPCPGCPVLKARDAREPQEIDRETPDGRYWNIRGYPVIDEVGKLVALAEFTHDVTERKQADDRFRRSQAMLARTERIAHIGSWEWEIASDTVTWSEELYRIHGRDPDGEAPNWAQHPALYHPEDFERLRHVAEKAASDGTRYEVELRALRKDGTYRICLARGFAEMGPDGRAVRLFGSFQDITDLRRAEEALRASEERLRLAHKATRDVVWDWDIVNDEQTWNDSGAVVFGWTDIVAQPQTAAWWVEKVHPDDRDRIDGSFFSVVDNPAEDYWHDEYRFLKADGSYAHVIDRGYVLRDQQGKALRMIGAMLDISDRKRAEEEKERLEEQFRQAQKLESVGRLAGGVAHDFNNMLGVIIANAESAEMDIGPEQPVHKNIEEILNASHRAAETVRQLLAFARKQIISPRILDLDDMVSRALKMLRRLIGEDITLRWIPGKAVGRVRMDATQIHQILANLVVNSRDAMAEGGTITIETANQVVDESHSRRHSGFLPGDYVVLTVSDTGVGMSQEVLEQVFDPFFTTKEVGKGTGLGLPMIYGSVKQNDGFIYIDSEPGEGTTVKIYLPRCEEALAGPEKIVETKAPEGKETVLLAEDEEALLLACRTALERQGYTVLSAESPIDALTLAEKHEGEIHLLVTDVVMPEMNGRALWERVQALHPSIKCLFMSGYTSDALGRMAVSDKGLHFIEKPFSFRDLADKVRSVLDG